MDSITQIVLGGAVGEAILGRKAGNKAILWGAICGTMPDLDVLAAPLLDTVHELHFHRGPSHSLLFSLLMAPVMGWLIAKIHRKSGIPARSWAWLAFGSLVTHPLLDIFTTWGTEFFWPFWGERVAFNTIFVVDPLYTVPFLLCLLIVLFLRRERKGRRIINWIGIGWSSLYLLFCVVQKSRAGNYFTAELDRQEIQYDRFRSSPTPLNSFLWHLEAENPEAFHIGFVSLWDPNKRVDVKAFPKKYQLPEDLTKNPNVALLLFLTKGWFLVEPDENGYWVRDMRFGRSGFELTEDEGFVFNYHINPNAEGDMISQERSLPDFKSGIWQKFRDRIQGK